MFLLLTWFIFFTKVSCEKTINEHPNWKYFPLEDCGQTIYQTINARIVGGTEAKIGQFPWIVRLGCFTEDYPDEPFFTCAGTLITSYYVLTAGHCGFNNSIARLGEYDSNTEIDCDEEEEYCSTYQDINIAEYVFNYYNKANNQHDISLLRLEKEAVINDFVRPICLPRGDIITEDLTGKKVEIAGWGYVDSSSYSTSNILMYITLPIRDRSECNAIYRHNLTTSQLCIGTAGKDSCNGDSGGGVIKLMKLDHVFRFYLLGLVSYGKKNCGKGPAVYTYVTEYLEDILNAVTQ